MSVGEEVVDSKEYLSDKGAEKVKLVSKGTLLFSFKLSIGRIAFAGRDLRTNEAIAALQLKDSSLLSKKYLAWFLASQDWDQITAKDEKLKGRTLNKKKLSKLGVDIPSLTEQKRIVEILGTAFEGIDQAITNAEQNLHNAQELFDSKLNSIFESAEESVELTPLSHLIEITHGFAFKGPDFRVSADESLPIVLTPGNYTESGELSFPLDKTKRFSGNVPEDYLFDERELTIVMTDLSSKMKILGKPAFINRPGVLHNQRIGRIKLKSENLDPRYLYYFFRTNRFLDQIKKTATGTMVRHTAPKRILAQGIPLPKSVAQQREAASFLDSFERDVLRLRECITQKEISLKALKRSILQLAFSGRLSERAASRGRQEAIA